MKKAFIVTASLLLPSLLFSQGQIQGFAVDPASPTTADFVKVYVDMTFNSGGCDLDNKAHSTTGNSTTASAHHCLGMLTVICAITDTFDLGYLQAGSHQFDFVLSSGVGGPGCSPGIVPDDSDSFSFNVTQSVGVNDNEKKKPIQFYPNPVNSSVTIILDSSLFAAGGELVITDAMGRQVYSTTIQNPEKIILENLQLTGGMYFFNLVKNSEVLSSGKFIVE